MKAREIIVTLVALLAIVVTSFWAYRYEQRRETAGMCPFCNRMVHPVTAYRVKDGNHVVAACCPRCGMHAQVSQTQGNPGLAWATDVNTGGVSRQNPPPMSRAATCSTARTVSSP